MEETTICLLQEMNFSLISVRLELLGEGATSKEVLMNQWKITLRAGYMNDAVTCMTYKCSIIAATMYIYAYVIYLSSYDRNICVNKTFDCVHNKVKN